MLGGLIDQGSASGLIDTLFCLGQGYEFSCKFSPGVIVESICAAQDVPQRPVGVILNVGYELKYAHQFIFQLICYPFRTHNLFLSETGPSLCACMILKWATYGFDKRETSFVRFLEQRSMSKPYGYNSSRC